MNTGYNAASHLKRWEDALSLNDETIQVTVSRSATSLEVARTRYNDYFPLLSLERFGEAQSLLHRCLTVFESEGSSVELGAVHSALADLEGKLRHPEEAVRHENTSLRYRYSVGQPGDCAISHFNLANSLIRTNADARVALAHRLASALIRYQTNEGLLTSTIDALRRQLGDSPPSFDELCTLVEQTEGVHFRDLFAHLPQRAASGDEALRAVLDLARS